MNTIEITAPTTQEAVAEAAKKLGVSAEALEVTVIEQTQGLFGKGKVRIRATSSAPPVEPAEPAVAAVAAAPAAPAAPAPRRERPKPRAVVEPSAPAEPEAPEAPEAPEEDASTEPVVEVVATEEDANELTAFISEILELADLDAEVSINEIHGRYVNVGLGGKDVSFLVGRRGEVINALQYLTNVISTRKIRNGVRVVIDGNGYRKERQDVLTKLATQIAEEVAKRREEAVLDALPAFERRVIHKALSEFPGVVTYSEGEEPNRRVVIAPAEA